MWIVFTLPNNTWGPEICCLPPWGRCEDTVRVQYFICTAGKCVFLFVHVKMGSIEPHLLTNSATISVVLSLSPPLWLADKKTATATILTMFPETAIVSRASVEGRLKIISSGAIRNGGRRQNIHSSLLLNCYPATLRGLINVAAGLYLCIYAYLALKDETWWCSNIWTYGNVCAPIILYICGCKLTVH